MHDDDAMDRLLQRAMRADVPRVPGDFDARVLRQVRPRRLSPAGRGAMVVYTVLAATLTAWSMRGVDPVAAGVGVTATLAIAAAAGAYVRWLIVPE